MASTLRILGITLLGLVSILSLYLVGALILFEAVTNPALDSVLFAAGYVALAVALPVWVYLRIRRRSSQGHALAAGFATVILASILFLPVAVASMGIA